MPSHLLAALLLSSVAINTPQSVQEPASLAEQDLAIAGLSSKSDTSDTKRVLGVPIARSHHEYHGNDEILHLLDWTYRDLLVSFYGDGRFYSATITGPTRVTVRGLRVRVAAQRVLALYGKHGFMNARSITYPYRPIGPGPSNWGMIVMLDNGVVQRIVLGVIGGVD